MYALPCIPPGPGTVGNTQEPLSISLVVDRRGLGGWRDLGSRKSHTISEISGLWEKSSPLEKQCPLSELALC